MNLDPLIYLSLAYFLSALLLIAASHKLVDLGRFAQALSDYRLLSSLPLRVAVVVLPLVELCCALALLLPLTQPLGGLICALIFSLYFCAIAINVARGHTSVDCGCSLFSKEAPLSAWHLLRNALLIVIASLLLLDSPARSLGVLDVLQILAAVSSLLLLYFSAETLLSNRRYLEHQKPPTFKITSTFNRGI